MSKYDLNFPQFDTFFISPDMWNKFKKIKPTFEESAYYDKTINWELPDDIDNEKIKIYLYLIFNNITEEDIKKLDISQKVWKYYVLLFNRTYFGNHDLTSDNDVNIGVKRPFGNSDVIGDISDEMSNDIDYINEILKHNIYEDEEEYDRYDIRLILMKHSKINESIFFKNFYSIMQEIIEKYEFKYINYEVREESVFKGSEYSDTQKNNILMALSTLFIPMRSEFRDDIIDDLINN